jgi:hypothetical protein
MQVVGGTESVSGKVPDTGDDLLVAWQLSAA